MAKTITLPAELPAHPIFLSLHATHGPDGCWHLTCLLAWAATYRPDGNLSGMTPAQIEHAAGWPRQGGEPEGFHSILHKAGALVGDIAEVNNLRISNELLPKKIRSDGNAPPCPMQAIVDAYHEQLPRLARVRTVSANTKTSVVNAWKSDPARQTIDWWRNYFAHVNAKCPFLLGKVEGSTFFADFSWLVAPKNMEKVINGRYDK